MEYITKNNYVIKHDCDSCKHDKCCKYRDIIDELEVIADKLEEWLEEQIGKLEEYGASFGLTIDEGISKYITDKISGYKNSLLKLKELKGSDEH